MQEIIKSKDVREYINQIGHHFTDFELATLIYNTDWSILEKLNALLELSNMSSDAELKKQIQDRINCDNRCMEQIKSNLGNCVFGLKIWVKEDHEYMDAGIFASWQLAESYAQKSAKKFQITKMVIYDTKQEWDDGEWCDSEIAHIIYNAEGQAVCYWGGDIDDSVPGNAERKRFEYAYVTVPHPFEEGDIVRIIGTDDVGIVRFYKKDEWKSREEKMKNWRPDYSDVSFSIEIPNEKAEFGHYHVSPMDVEYANLEDDDVRKKLLEMASYFVKGECYIQEFQAYCEHYAEK